MKVITDIPQKLRKEEIRGVGVHLLPVLPNLTDATLSREITKYFDNRNLLEIEAMTDVYEITTDNKKRKICPRRLMIYIGEISNPTNRRVRKQVLNVLEDLGWKEAGPKEIPIYIYRD